MNTSCTSTVARLVHHHYIKPLQDDFISAGLGYSCDLSRAIIGYEILI